MTSAETTRMSRLPSPDSPIASIRDLQVTFQRGRESIRALRGVSLDVHRGENLALVGESGSGKSTVGLSLLGLLPKHPQAIIAGEVLVEGSDMLRASPEERRRVRRLDLGAVFQDPMTSLNPTMRVGRQVAEAAGSSAEAAVLLSQVGLPDASRWMGSYPHELSGGQRQRVMIAMAIAGRPSLVIADEPTTALDVTIQAQVLALLKGLSQRTSIAFLFITHDLGVAAAVADRVAVLYGGLVEELGSVGQVIPFPAHPYTVALLHTRLTMEAPKGKPLPTLEGEPPDPRSPPPGCPFADRCGLRIDACVVSVPPLVRSPSGSMAACIRLPDVARLRSNVTVEARWPSSRTGTGDEPVLAVSNLRKTFYQHRGLSGKTRLDALRGVSLEVRIGEAVAIVGESGCGKSTLLRVCAGLTRPDQGEVRTMPDTHPQMVFQDAVASLTPWMKVGALLRDRLAAARISRRAWPGLVSTALARVGLPAEIEAARPAQLSGGQAQRVALARAVILPPRLLLCDEPTSSLDVSLSATVLNLIGQLRRELGLSVLFVTHDLAAARAVADRLVVMYLGRVVEIGPADDISANPRHPYTKALIAAIPGYQGVRPLSRGDPSSPLNIPSGCSYHPRCAEAITRCRTEDQELRRVTLAGDHMAACVHVKALNGVA